MNHRNKVASAILVLAVLAVAFILAIPSDGTNRANAAPQAIVTPVASVNLQSGTARVYEFFDAEVLTADKRTCFEASAYEIVDFQHVIDVGTVNTTTLTIQHTNDLITFDNGPVPASAVVADEDALVQHAVFGRYTCVNADLTITSPITITAIGVFK